MNKVFCFGELLLRLSPRFNQPWLRSGVVPVNVAGAEFNVASALINWGIPVRYCTVLPDNYLCREIYGEINQKNIDTSAIYFRGNRIGIYYLPYGKDLKHGGVIYDRAYSSFSELKPGTIDWSKELDGCSWFHFSAICPALNDDVAATCKEALIASTKKNITVSIDLNYREKLWQYRKKPVDVMPSLIEHCDVVMGNVWSAGSLLGIPVNEHVHQLNNKTAYLEHAQETAHAIMKAFPNTKTVANTFRFDEVSGIRYYAVLDNREMQFTSQEFTSSQIVDKVGSGDCFMAGLIYGLYNGMQFQDIINYAASAAFGKLHEQGDATQQTISDVKKRIL